MFLSKLYTSKFFIMAQRIFRSPIRNPLGRWNLESCHTKTTIQKVDWANEDHCGPCGYSKMQSYKNKTIIQPKKYNLKGDIKL